MGQGATHGCKSVSKNGGVDTVSRVVKWIYQRVCLQCNIEVGDYFVFQSIVTVRFFNIIEHWIIITWGFLGVYNVSQEIGWNLTHALP